MTHAADEQERLASRTPSRRIEDQHDQLALQVIAHPSQ